MCLFASSATGVFAEDGFYLGLSGQWFNVDVQGLDGDQVGAKLYGGYRFGNMDNLLDYIAVEATFQKSGEIDGDVDVDGQKIDVDLMLDGYTLEVLGIIPAAEIVEIYGKLGYYDFNAEVDGIGLSFDTDEHGLTAGIGVMFEVIPEITVRLELNWFDVDDSAWTLGLGAQMP